MLNTSKLKCEAMATQLDTFFGFIPNSPKTIDFWLVGRAAKYLLLGEFRRSPDYVSHPKILLIIEFGKVVLK